MINNFNAARWNTTKFTSNARGHELVKHQNLVRQKSVLLDFGDFLLEIAVNNYLPNLQVRNKWQRDSQNVKEGTVVLIMDP